MGLHGFFPGMALFFVYRLRRLRVVKIFETKRNEVTGGRRKLHNEELHNLYSSPSIIRMMKSRRMRWACSTYGENNNSYRILVGKSEGRRPLGRPIGWWEDNIKMDDR
jgi:hypothetical protein